MKDNPLSREVGSYYRPDNAIQFVVWAPHVEKVELEIVGPSPALVPMQQDELGYWEARIPQEAKAVDYFYKLNGEVSRPDPASHFQPRGVHRQSRTVDHGSYEWQDSQWRGIPLERMIMYELHIGTFTPEGTLAAAQRRLSELKESGVNAVDIMPVAQFPGDRNWGYDGVHPYAVQNSYGGPEALKEFVDAAHALGLAVILDVVYNHLGPEGNYLSEFGPYFTDKYRTPWGMAVNYDDAHSDGVRNYFGRNALFWFREYHIDALRLDAVHSIYDFSARPFLQELADATTDYSQTADRKHFLIAESNLDDVNVLYPTTENGLGMDSQWSDDFHHSVHTLLTGENDGYYRDFGKVEHLVKSVREGFAYDWRYSQYRRRRHGSSSIHLPGEQFVISIQTHDQVGNRAMGERLTALAPFEALKAAAVCMFFSPNVPMLFMGEEYAEVAPFLYFVSHTDEDLVEAVRKGRTEEFAEFKWRGEPPDPQAVETFSKSKLNWNLRTKGQHARMLELYKALILLRHQHPALQRCDKTSLTVQGDEARRIIGLSRRHKEQSLSCVINFSDNDIDLDGFDDFVAGREFLDTGETRWGGPGKRFVREKAVLRAFGAVIFEQGEKQ